MKFTLHQRAKVRAQELLYRAVFRLSMWYNPDCPAESSGQILIALGAIAVRTPAHGEVVVYLPRWQKYSPVHRLTATRYLDNQLEMGRVYKIEFGQPPAPVFDLGAARRRRRK